MTNGSLPDHFGGSNLIFDFAQDLLLPLEQIELVGEFCEWLILQENPVIYLIIDEVILLQQSVEQTVEVAVLRLLVELQPFDVVQQSLQFPMLCEQFISLSHFDLNDCPAFLELCLFHVFDLCAPRQFALEHVGDEVHQTLQVVSAGWEVAHLVVIARKLHIEYPHFEALLGGLDGVLLGLRVHISVGFAIVDEVEFAVVLSLA